MAIYLTQQGPKAIYIGNKNELDLSGIYTKNGLISISSDGNNWITISDKNLDMSNIGDYGYYYQRGNNYDFPNSGGVVTTYSSVDTTGYGPGNYYSDSSYRIGSGDWSSPSNNDLWGDITNTNIARQGPCDLGYHIPSATELLNIINIGTNWGLSGGSWLVNYLKIPYNGIRDEISTVQFQGSWGFYWTSTPSSNNSSNGCFLQFSSSVIETQTLVSGATKKYGMGIRPFKNTPSIPDNTRTVLYQPS